MFLATEGFRETIGSHLSRRNILNPNDFVLNGFTDEMMTDVDMFSTSVGYWILCKSNGTLIIGEEICRFVRITVTVCIAELCEKRSNPFQLLRDLCESHVLRFHRR